MIAMTYVPLAHGVCISTCSKQLPWTTPAGGKSALLPPLGGLPSMASARQYRETEPVLASGRSVQSRQKGAKRQKKDADQDAAIAHNEACAIQGEGRRGAATCGLGLIDDAVRQPVRDRGQP